MWEAFALCQGQHRDWDDAAESYHEAVKLDPDNRMSRKNLGFTLARAGRFDEGYEWLKRVMREPEARYNLAGIMLFMNEPEKARAQLTLALRADPDFAPARERLVTITAAPAGPPPSMNFVRPASYQEAVPDARPVKPAAAAMPREPVPVGVSSARPVAPAYVATTGWDGVLPR